MTLFVAFLLAAAPPAVVATPATPPVSVAKIDPKTLEAAERLLTAMDYDKMMTQMVDTLDAQSETMVRSELEGRLGQEVDDELVKRLADLQRRHTRSTLLGNDKVRRAIAALYARYFTVAELDRLAALYDDPAMRKWTVVAPKLMGDMLPLIMSMTRDSGIEDEAKKIVIDYLNEKEGGSGS